MGQYCLLIENLATDSQAMFQLLEFRLRDGGSGQAFSRNHADARENGIRGNAACCDRRNRSGQQPKSRAARFMLSITETPKGQRFSQLPQPIHSDALCSSAR